MSLSAASTAFLWGLVFACASWAIQAGAGNEDCSIPCPHGEVVGFSQLDLYQPRGSKHLFEANGCGTTSVRLDAPEELVPCCNLHDACYSVCGVSRTFCDEEFARCLTKRCADGMAKARETKRTKSPGNSARACESSAKILSMGVRMFGCSAFTEAQQDRCACVDPSSRQSNLRTLVRDHLYALSDKSDEFVDNVVRRVLASKTPEVLIFRILETYNATLVHRVLGEQPTSDDEL